MNQRDQNPGAPPGAPQPGRQSILVRIFLSPDERRLRAGWRLLAHFGLLLLLLACTLIPVSIWMAASGSSTPSLLVMQLLTFFPITLSIYLARRFLDRRTFASLGLTPNQQALKDLIAGFLFTGAMMGLIYGLETAAGWLKFQSFAWESIPASQIALDVSRMFFLFVLVGWQEELLSRGYWLQNLAEGSNLYWGVLISSGLFALAHQANPHISWVALLGLLLAGIFLAYGYLRTRQLWLPIGLHIGWNFFEGVVFGFPVSGLEGMPSLLQHTVQGPELLTGGRFGPEAGLILLPGLALGAALIAWYTRNRG